jgi:hypothetical protein
MGISLENAKEILSTNITSGFLLKQKITDDYRSHRQSAQSRSSLWNEWCEVWVKQAMQQLDTVFESKIPLNQFINAQQSALVIDGENYKWCGIQNYIDAKLNFMIELNTQISATDKLNVVSINIGNGSKVGGDINTIQGNNNSLQHISPEDKKFYETPLGIFILTIVAGLVLAGIVNLLDWN